jgi:cyclomaltodextrinase
MKRIHRNLRHLLSIIVFGCAVLNCVAAPKGDAPNPASRKSPDWLRRSVVYEIFPRNFSNEGTFNGIIARLDELKDLGVNILWLMPIHPIGQKMRKGSVGSPFAVRDFYAVNPDYGTTNDFKRLVTESHNRNLKVIIGLIAGHTAWDSVLMEHPDFYLKDTNGVIIPPNPGWTDVAGLNYANPEVRQYMTGMMKYWLRDFGVDGFRCDVVPTVPMEFWEAARAELEKVNPEVIILADAGAKPALLAKAFDVDSSWNFASTLDLVMSSVRPASLLRESWEHTQEQFPKGALHLRFTDSHEEPRAVARFGLDGALAAQALMLVIDGLPMFYNGMEAGDATESADPALFEKMPVFWHPGGRPPLRDIYRDLIKLRTQNAAFYNGEVQWLQNTAPGELVSLLRKEGKDEFLVLMNFSSRRVTGSVELANATDFEPVKISGAKPPAVDTRLPELSLGGYGWYVYHRALVLKHP